eukprot:GFUD01134643.1.p1 GENE.GFUD01134643.1~~GFUD01134643.1.p1  ORF type:complete len:374 (-),score=100.42 GFUD01134643.1:52-1173(-)
MSKAWGVTHYSDVVDFCYDWKVVNFGRCLKIQQQIESPPLVIPGTNGLVCHLVCTRDFPRMVWIQVNDVVKVVKEPSLFSITLQCEKRAEDVKLAGYVEVLCDNVWLRGSFGDQTKEQFTSFAKVGNNKLGWSFIPAKPMIKFLGDGHGLTDFLSVSTFIDFNGFWHDSKQNQPQEIKLTLFSPGEMTQTSSLIPPTVMDNTSRLAAMKSLMLDAKHSDVVLECQGEKFNCHKSILGARSTVFTKMFDANMKEAASVLVGINDVEPDIVQTMVEFIYTGDVTKQIEDLAKVVYVADKYRLEGFLDFCFRKFDIDREDDQLIEMLLLADKHNLDQFKDLAMKRIIVNKAKYIADENFRCKIQDHPEILFELFKA